MIARLIRNALTHRWGVLFAAALVAGMGVWAYTQQKVDAYPDISAEMVLIITEYPGRAPEEVELQVTLPIEIAMRNVPRVEVVRSRTIFGLSEVQLVFEEGVESYWARQRVQERLAAVELPEEASTELGPLATAYGEIYRYELRTDGRQDLMELRTLNDWVVIPRLMRVPGVAEVANFGGLAKQFSVTVDPFQLERFNLSVADLVEAIQANHANAGGNVMLRGSMSFVIRGRGVLTDLEDIRSIYVQSVGGTPISIRDVAAVELDHIHQAGIFSKGERVEREGAVSIEDRPDSVEGIVLMRRHENPSEVLAGVNAAVRDLNAGGLPDGARVEPFYDRTELVNNTLYTVTHSVLAGITLVVLVLLIFLGSPAMATLVALTIPFSLLTALMLMHLVDIPIGLLSIGAIDFGIIVDGSVIMADNIARRLGAENGRPRRSVRETVLAAALEVERPVYYSMLMIIAAYLPLLTLTSIEGLLFRPMALTIVFALIGALVFALFLVPVLATFFFRQGYTEWENPLLRMSRPLYGGVLRMLLKLRWIVVPAVFAMFALVYLGVVRHMGIEFLPRLDEGVIWVRANFPEGMSLQQTARYGDRIRATVLELPDVEFIAVQSGRNDDGTDPFPPSRMEIMIGPKPRERWVEVQSTDELMAAISDRLREEYPTTRFNFTQPIIDSVTEDTNGTSADLAVEISGPDFDTLASLAGRAVELLRGIEGSVDVNIEQEGPQPQLVIEPDRALCARYDVRVEDVTNLIDTALGGQPVGTIFEEQRLFDIVVRFGREFMDSPEAIGRLPVFNAAGVPIPLAQVCRIERVDGQTMIARQNDQRRITVRCDIVGRDQGGFVREAQQQFAEALHPHLPAGYRVEWLGMFENLDRAARHFAILIPVTIGVIFVLLLVTFQSVKAAVLVLMAVPFAFIGGCLALHLRDMNLNVSGGVGFAALFGVAIMDGVLMVRAITTYRMLGRPLDDAILEGAQVRMRPILMTSAVAILGLLPASLATGIGSDVQRPLATVIVWGLLSASVLTLFIVPVFYRLFTPGLPKSDAEHDEDSLAAVH